MLDYNIFSYAKPGFCRYMPHFNVFITEPVTTGFLQFFAVLVRSPWFLKNSGTSLVRSSSPEGLRTGTGPDLEALIVSQPKYYNQFTNSCLAYDGSWESENQTICLQLTIDTYRHGINFIIIQNHYNKLMICCLGYILDLALPFNVSHCELA